MVQVDKFDSMITDTILILNDTVESIEKLEHKRLAITDESEDSQIDEIKKLIEDVSKKYGILNMNIKSIKLLGDSIFELFCKLLNASSTEYDKYFGLDLNNSIATKEVPFEFKIITMSDNENFHITPIDSAEITNKQILEKFIPETLNSLNFIYNKYGKDCSIDKTNKFFKDVYIILQENFTRFIMEDPSTYITEFTETRVSLMVFKNQLLQYMYCIDAVKDNVNSILGNLESLSKEKYSL